MKEIKEDGWLEYESIEHPTLCHYDAREVFNTNGGWLYSPMEGFDFKATKEAGYIYHWSDKMGDEEYIIKVSLDTFKELLYEYTLGEGTEVLIDYRNWEYRDGRVIATKIVT